MSLTIRLYEEIRHAAWVIAKEHQSVLADAEKVKAVAEKVEAAITEALR